MVNVLHLADGLVILLRTKKKKTERKVSRSTRVRRK